MHGTILDAVEWMRGECTGVCGDCGNGIPSSDMEFGRYCTQGDESKVWDVAPWDHCHFAPSLWAKRGDT